MWCYTSTHERNPFIVRPWKTVVSSSAIAVQSLVVVNAVRHQSLFVGSIGCPLLCLCLKDGRFNPFILSVFVCIDHGVLLASQDWLSPLYVLSSLRPGWGNFIRQFIDPFIIVSWQIGKFYFEHLSFDFHNSSFHPVCDCVCSFCVFFADEYVKLAAKLNHLSPLYSMKVLFRCFIGFSVSFFAWLKVDLFNTAGFV